LIEFVEVVDWVNIDLPSFPKMHVLQFLTDIFNVYLSYFLFSYK